MKTFIGRFFGALASVIGTLSKRFLNYRHRDADSGVETNSSVKEIIKGEGLTKSEKQLARLADHSFLDLWAYPNPYIDKVVGGQGKELCDLLVVCGNDVIIFSDKEVEWPDGSDEDLAWSRWYRRAIKKSVDQVNGAARWISRFPSRIFLDKQCKLRLPIELPSPSDIRLHGIVVARGAGRASRKRFGGGTGSLVVNGQATTKAKPGQPPFPILNVGDINPGGMFVHVLDDGSLEFALKELDTISDFADYLLMKEELVRSGNLHAAEGEEDLIAYYVTHMITPDEHGFPHPQTNAPLGPGDKIQFERVFSELIRHPQYVAKNIADQPSYIWDKLIRVFTGNMMAGTTVTQDDQDFDLSAHEVAIRFLARETRFRRRLLGEGILEALKRGRSEDRYTRGFMPAPGRESEETAYFFLTLKPPRVESGISYERYRKVRIAMLETYAYAFLERNRNLPRIIGIGTEPAMDEGEAQGSSEDMIMAEQTEWTAQLLQDLNEQKQQFGIMLEGNYSEKSAGGHEWPDAMTTTPTESDPSEGV